MRLENRFGISAGFAKASDEMIFGMVEEVAVPANAMKPAAIRREALQLEEEDASEGDLDLAGNGVRDIPVAGNRPLQRRVRAPEDQNLRSALEGRLRMAAEDSVAGDRFFLDEVANDFVAVRVYAHQLRADRKIGDRVDFTETLYWNAGVKTDQDGKTTVEFALNDSVTSFRASVDAFAENGALGQSSVIIESIQPFYLEPKLPLEVSTGGSGSDFQLAW